MNRVYISIDPYSSRVSALHQAHAHVLLQASRIFAPRANATASHLRQSCFADTAAARS